MQKFLTTLFLVLALFLSACSANAPVPEPSPVIAEAPAPVMEEAPLTESAPGTYYGNYYGNELSDAEIAELDTPTGSPEVEEVPVVRSAPPAIDVDEISRQLSWASFGYTVPEEANIDEEFEVIMLVNPLLSEEDIEANLGEGQRTTGRVQIARVVEAKLTSRDFEIQSVTPDRQVVMRDRNTKWIWSLKPLSAGPDKKIKITVNAIVVVDGERTERYIETYTDTVKVDITVGQRLSQWFANNWEWAWSALLIPIGGYFWNRKRQAAKD